MLSTYFRSVRSLQGSRHVAAASCVLLFVLAACDSPADPRLELVPSAATVEFRAVRGSTQPQTRTVSVMNTGGGRLGPVSCPAAPADWLACSVSGGNAVTLTADPSGLEADPGPVSVALSAPGGSATIEVSLVLEQAILSVGPAAVAFSAVEGSDETTPGSATVTVSNVGAGELADLGTITCVPTPAAPRVGCAVDAATGALTVTVDPDELEAGTYAYTLSVDAEHNQVARSVAVTLTVIASPRIGLSRPTVHFEAARGSQTPVEETVTVTNLGGGELGAISCPASPAPWLECEAVDNVLILTADPSGLTQSPDPVVVGVSAANAINSPAPLTVTLSLTAPPTLVLTPSAVHFEGIRGSSTPIVRTVAISNGGLGSLGTLACPENPAAWLTCSIADTTLTLSANPSGLTASPVPVAVQVTGSLAANSPLALPVSFAIEQPVLAVSATSVSFTGSGAPPTTPAQVVVTVTNAGAGTRAQLGAIACAVSAPAACAVDQGAGELTLTVDPTGLAAGTHVFVATVSAPHASNGSVTITIVLTVT